MKYAYKPMLKRKRYTFYNVFVYKKKEEKNNLLKKRRNSINEKKKIQTKWKATL